MNSDFQIRSLKITDIPKVTNWSRMEGFAPGIGDVSIYQHTDRQGLWVGWLGSVPIGCIAGVKYNPSYGFIEGNDAFSEIIVGRFSANNPMELITQVERSIDYEKNPGENTEHFNKALGIASTQGPGYGGLPDSQFNDLLWNC